MSGVDRVRWGVVPLALAVLIGVAGVTASARARLSRASVTRCPAGALKLVIGPPVPAQTGEHAIEIEIRNLSPATCSLKGYPTVAFRSGRRALPFRYRDGGGPYLPGAGPRLVRVRPGRMVWFIVAKYRCDVGTLASATAIDVRLPGSDRWQSLPLRHRYVGWIGYCRRASGSRRPDPGNTVAMTPVSATPNGP